MEANLHGKPSTLKDKLTLLKHLREGNIEEVHRLLQNLSKNARTNPQLYQKFNTFVSNHKEDIIEMEQEDSQKQEIIIQNIEDVDVDDQPYDSDYSLSQSSQSGQEEGQINERTKIIFQDRGNIGKKKDPEEKKQFNVPTKPVTPALSSQVKNAPLNTKIANKAGVKRVFTQNQKKGIKN